MKRIVRIEIKARQTFDLQEGQKITDEMIKRAFQFNQFSINDFRVIEEVITEK